MSIGVKVQNRGPRGELTSPNDCDPVQQMITASGDVPSIDRHTCCIASLKLIRPTRLKCQQVEASVNWKIAMTNHQRDEYVLRDGIMNLLSDEEVARVSTAETAQKLADGDEYIDLEQLEQGVLRGQSTPTPMGHVLPRKAVHEDTWSKIVMTLTRSNLTDTQPSRRAPHLRHS